MQVLCHGNVLILLAGKHIVNNRPLFQVLIKLGARLFVVNSQYSVSLGWLSSVL